jgi:UDP-N-acetylglucosamine diphosphorylase/glucosamine-1-phosphate N-acetyltransferase
MPLIVAEENWENFGALAQTRATFELRFGALCALDRALLVTGDVALRCRPELAEYLRAKTGLPVNEDAEGELFPGLPAATPWEILNASAHYIAEDFSAWSRQGNHRDSGLMVGAHIVGNRNDLFLGRGASVGPGCVLDVRGGPIIVAEKAHVNFSQLQGPVFVGRGCLIDGALLRPGTSLGPHCKVGGEVASSIFQARVNKAHAGFVGHSWAGRWVNFGAMATTSNLKNTYGKIRFQQNASTLVETGVQMLGSLIGDHTKIGIGQLLATGSHLGVGCNIFGGGVAGKYIPSFSWGGADGWVEHRLTDCLRTVHATLARRNAVLRPASEAVLRHLFQATALERMQFLTRQAG